MLKQSLPTLMAAVFAGVVACAGAAAAQSAPASRRRPAGRAGRRSTRRG